jgi:hypothetical protein
MARTVLGVTDSAFLISAGRQVLSLFLFSWRWYFMFYRSILSGALLSEQRFVQ